ncbi:LuxR C-terminal-related transcriptional regulator [Sinomonas sp. JGH33]|uniref:LuxR C-terminal-related transcriptional regulator n=1 Tax=Sinomonas terricola TaxID=3110330 RepID=A0ABU5TC18_9MICC|nr:LuxR C-terminal-related transcriptional regulator [Sinomonas sp. JGH33]MEA5457237.1 LuxR C-terminal-related transcriptional regulator [Sinomonas sp. JGH33]
MATGTAPSALTTAVAGRVPASASSFIGRIDELAAVDRALATGRLVTLTGPGGAGKTRIALEAVSRDGSRSTRVVFVDLTRIPAGSSLAFAVAEAAGLRGVTEEAALASILWWLDLGEESLVILDSAEHILGEAAALVAALLENAGRARVLVTSRQPLRLAGERIVNVGPMPVDDAESLFWERALAVRASLPETPDARAAARELCSRLDCLPLAVELAAARASVLTPAELLPELARGLAVLSRGPAMAPDRHASLHACIAASIDALDGRERGVFEACSVFAGSFDARAAAAVAGASLADLEALVSRSLLQTSADAAGRTAFRMLETLREYAVERLTDGRLAEIRGRHLAWMMSELGTGGFPSVTESLRRGAEAKGLLPDLRAALDFAATTAPAAGILLMASTEELWRLAAEDEGFARVERLLEQYPEPDEVRAAGLVTAACLSLVRQDIKGVRDSAEQALGILEPRSAAAGTVLYYVAVALLYGGDFEGSTLAAMRAFDAFAAIGDVAGQGCARGALGSVALFAGRSEDAIPFFEEALPLAEEAGDAWRQGQILTHWAMAEEALGHRASAHEKLLGALEQFLQVGDISIYGSAIARLALLDVRRRPTAAVRAAASASQRQGAGGRYHSTTLADIDQVRATAARLIGEGAVRSAWETGERLTFDQAAAELLRLAEPREGTLTPRELEIAEMVRRGHSNASIAKRLGLSERTIESHVAHATTKLGLHNRAGLAAWAAERGKSSADN